MGLPVVARAAEAASGAVPPKRMAELVKAVQAARGTIGQASLANVPLSVAETGDLLRAIARGEVDPKSITPALAMRLRKTPDAVNVVDDAPPAPVMEAVAVDEAPRPFSQVGKSLVSDEDPTVQVQARGDGETFVYPDGVVVDVNGNVIGRTAPQDLTDVSATPDDNLAASATELDSGKPKRDGRRNVTPNTKRVDKEAELAGSIWQATTPNDLEAVSQRSIKQLLAAAQQYRLPDGTYSPAFLKKISPDAATASARLSTLEQMAGVSNQQRAAEQIGGAADARAAAGVPRPAQPTSSALATLDRRIGVPEELAGANDYDIIAGPSRDGVSELLRPDLEDAREVVGEGLPAGNWGALTSAFNALDADQRRAVMAALPLDTRRFLSAMLDSSSREPSFLPNLVASRTRPINEVDELFAQRELAKQAGDQETVDAINELLQGTSAAPPEDMTDAIRAVTERNAAVDALRNALIGQDELVMGTKLRNQLAAVPRPQPAVITPGARTPEFQASDLPDAEMPTAYDTTKAVIRETNDALDARAAGGGLSEKQRTQGFGVQNQRDLPLAFRGRDRNPPNESRARGERAGGDTSYMEEVIRDANVLQGNIDSAQKAVNEALLAAKSASGAAELARATQRVTESQDALRAAYKAMDDAYPARLVNPRTGEVKRAPAAMLSGEADVPKGFIIERGRRAMPDAVLNKGGTQETFEESLLAALGWRPRARQNLSRSSVDLSAEDARALSAEADDVFGDDAAELVDGDFDPNWDVNGAIDRSILLEANGAQKKTRLGGTQQQSRVQGGMETMLDDSTPLQYKGEGGAPLYADPQAVAADILSRQRIFKPGTANYEMAKDRLAQLIERRFPKDPSKENGLRIKSDPDGLVRKTPEGSMGGAFDSDEFDIPPVSGAAEPVNVSDDLAASATDLGPESPVEAPAKKSRRGKKSQAADAATPVAPVAGRAKTVKEIQDEASEIERTVRRQSLDDGMTKTAADKAARAARKKHVDDEMAKLNGVTGDTKPVENAPAAADAPAAPAADAPPPVAGDAAPPAVAAVDGDAAKPVGDAAAPAPDAPKPPDGEPLPKKDGTTPAPAPTPPEKRGILRRVAGKVLPVAAVGGLIAASNMGGKGNVGGDGWSLPPGAGGPPGGGVFPPIPVGVGGDGASLMAPETEQERLSRMLEQIRASRAMSPIEPSMTLMHYNAGYR